MQLLFINFISYFKEDKKFKKPNNLQNTGNSKIFSFQIIIPNFFVFYRTF